MLKFVIEGGMRFKIGQKFALPYIQETTASVEFTF